MDDEIEQVCAEIKALCGLDARRLVEGRQDKEQALAGLRNLKAELEASIAQSSEALLKEIRDRRPELIKQLRAAGVDISEAELAKLSPKS